MRPSASRTMHFTGLPFRSGRAAASSFQRQVCFERLENRMLLAGGSFLYPAETLDFSVQVNSDSMVSNGQPAVDIAPDGDFQVVWQSGGDIHAKAYHATLAPKQTQPVNLTEQVPLYPWSPDIATNDSGESFAAWTHPIHYASYHQAVFGQRIAADGTPSTTAPTEVYEDCAYFYDTRVAMANDGRFVVGWTETDADPDFFPASDVYCQFFREDGLPLGATVDVASTSLYEYMDGVAVNSADQTSVVVWRQALAETPDNFDIYFRMYSFSGGHISGLVQPTLVGTGVDAAVAMDDAGRFVVSWIHQGDVLAQRFTDQGIKLGSTVVLADGQPAHSNANTNLDVSISGSQGVVGFERYVGDYDYESVVKHFQFAGNSIIPGIQYSLGETDHGFGAGPSVAMNVAGQSVATYVRKSDHSVRARAFRPDGISVWPGQVFVMPDGQLLPHIRCVTVSTPSLDLAELNEVEATTFSLTVDGTNTDEEHLVSTDVLSRADSGESRPVAERFGQMTGSLLEIENELYDAALLEIVGR